MSQDNAPRLHLTQEDQEAAKDATNGQPPDTQVENERSTLDFLKIDPRNYAELDTSDPPTPKEKAQLLYEYCLTSDKKVPESVHNLYAIGEHYAHDGSEDLKSPETINGIPAFFSSLSRKDKAEYCYNQVIEMLSSEAAPVTVNSLLATKRSVPNDPTSSVAGRFVRRVTRYVCLTLVGLVLTYLGYLLLQYVTADPKSGSTIDHTSTEVRYLLWAGFGCVGALVHLLNHALTTTRLQTFDASEERKVGPRLLLGGLFGVVLPTMLDQTKFLSLSDGNGLGAAAAFFAGYSVRFSIGFLERVLEALFPETKSKS